MDNAGAIDPAITVNGTPYSTLLAALNAWVVSQPTPSDYLSWAAKGTNASADEPAFAEVKLNDANYTTLQEAIDAASTSGNTITLLKDVTANLIIENDEDFILNLDTYNLTGDGTTSVIRIKSGATLKLTSTGTISGNTALYGDDIHTRGANFTLKGAVTIGEICMGATKSDFDPTTSAAQPIIAGAGLAPTAPIALIFEYPAEDTLITGYIDTTKFTSALVAYEVVVSGTDIELAATSEDTFTVRGTINSGNGATVTLMQGNDICTTAAADVDGKYSFGTVPAGTYNVVATKDETVTTADVTANATLTSYNSTLVVEADTPPMPWIGHPERASPLANLPPLLLQAT